MSKEEPAWRRDLFRAMYGRVSAHGVLTIVDLVAPHIEAAYQRGLQDGVSRSGDSVGKLRARLATLRSKATEWAALAPPDDWADTPGDTQLSDAGRYLLALLDAPDKA